ncbi:WD40 repeat-like protein [Rhodotorula sp. JG-1b]|nr:WD40 repeat-like protein [Rhodotorula sp. JG-1b]
MAYTSDSDKLFLSDAQHEQSAIRAARARVLADRGAPIQLPSKPISVRVRSSPRGGGRSEPEAWIAESGFVVRRVALESGKTQQVYRGHTGPVTSLDFYAVPLGGGKTRQVLISGSWDKSFRVWDVQTKALLSTTVGHLDFVKAVHVIPDLSVLVTASSDKDIRVWDLAALDNFDFASLTSTGVDEGETPAPRQGAAPPPARPLRPLPCLLALKAHTRPIEVLASYPLLRELPDGVADDEVDVSLRERTGRIALVSADSMGALKIWEIWREEGQELKGELRSEVRQHEGGIYDLALSRDGEMWTASVDNSVLLAQLSLTSASAAPTPLLRIPHPAQVRSVLPLASVFPDSPYLVTGSSDELFRLIDLSSSAALDPNPAREAKREWRGLPLAATAPVQGCVRTVEAHTHEVVQLCAYVSSDGQQQWLLSASLDNTLRRWKWPDVLTQEMDKVVVVKETAPEESLLTEEEERELAELMGDDN